VILPLSASSPAPWTWRPGSEREHRVRPGARPPRKAALLHLRQAEDLAELAGVDIDASEHDVREAGLIRAAGEAVEDLDLWAINNARTSGADPRETYARTGNWRQAEGGSLPAGSWPRLQPGTATLAASPGFRQLIAHLDEAGAREAGQ
jgi:hypothetical protein